MFSLSPQGELRREEGCLSSSGGAGAHVRVEPCPVGKALPDNMVWDYDRETKILKHKASGNCMDAEHLSASNPVIVQTCADKDTQKWELEHYL